MGTRGACIFTYIIKKSRFYAKKSYFLQLRREARKYLGYFVWIRPWYMWCVIILDNWYKYAMNYIYNMSFICSVWLICLIKYIYLYQTITFMAYLYQLSKIITHHIYQGRIHTIFMAYVHTYLLDIIFIIQSLNNLNLPCIQGRIQDFKLRGRT
jgi:hypothetical protein